MLHESPCTAVPLDGWDKTACLLMFFSPFRGEGKRFRYPKGPDCHPLPCPSSHPSFSQLQSHADADAAPGLPDDGPFHLVALPGTERLEHRNGPSSGASCEESHDKASWISSQRSKLYTQSRFESSDSSNVC